MKKILLVSLLMVTAIHPGRDRGAVSTLSFGKICLLALIGSAGNAFSADTCDVVKGCPAPPFPIPSVVSTTGAPYAPKNHPSTLSGFQLTSTEHDALMKMWKKQDAEKAVKDEFLRRSKKRVKRKKKKIRV